jgi:hypothetical protein
MLSTEANSRLGECNYRAGVMGVECTVFRWFERGACPGTPRRYGVCARPETPHSATRRTLKPDASFSQGVRLILRHVTVTFSTPQTPFVLQDQSAKERKNA